MAGVQIVGMEQPSDDTPSVTPVGRASSLPEGAVERSETEGVYYDERKRS